MLPLQALALFQQLLVYLLSAVEACIVAAFQLLCWNVAIIHAAQSHQFDSKSSVSVDPAGRHTATLQVSSIDINA